MINLFLSHYDHYHLIFAKTIIYKGETFRDDDVFDLFEIAILEYVV